MELWIRSQDKTTLIRSYEIYISEYGKGSYVIRAKKTSHILGAYKTMERALEVLDEIEERIMLLNTTNFVYDTDTLVSFKIALGEDKIKGLSYPYQMPEN